LTAAADPVRQAGGNMEHSVPLARTLSIRDCGFDESWLQDQISEDPSCVGLGDLEFVSRERRQKAGGRLDLLLKNPDDNAMYEVEIMLGATDESHIVRTIEYWDNERRKWPQRQHFAVLVAESVTRRFFNVIQLLSQSIPIIAIQANIVESEGHRSLHFTKVLDAYEEPEEPGTEDVVGEGVWRKEYPWIVDVANSLTEAAKTSGIHLSLRFFKTLIQLTSDEGIYFWLFRRKAGKARLGFWLSDGLVNKGTSLLDEAGLSYVRPRNSIYLNPDKTAIESNAKIFGEISKLIKQSYREE
jgi:hypothetical protein